MLLTAPRKWEIIKHWEIHKILPTPPITMPKGSNLNLIYLWIQLPICWNYTAQRSRSDWTLSKQAGKYRLWDPIVPTTWVLNGKGKGIEDNRLKVAAPIITTGYYWECQDNGYSVEKMLLPGYYKHICLRIVPQAVSVCVALVLIVQHLNIWPYLKQVRCASKL